MTQHPACWTPDRVKCFLIHIADARKKLEGQTVDVKLSDDWVKFTQGHPSLRVFSGEANSTLFKEEQEYFEKDECSLSVQRI